MYMYIPLFKRFGQKFVDKVANPKDMIHFTRRKITKVKTDEKGMHILFYRLGKKTFLCWEL